MKYPKYIENMQASWNELFDYLWLNGRDLDEQTLKDLDSQLNKLALDIDEECYIYDKENGSEWL